MASASASASTIFNPKRLFKYDVFISYRAQDSRNFFDHLSAALDHQGIRVFKDKNKLLLKGKRLGVELIKVIEDSNFFIIVFSENYASSSWCLWELAKIMERHKTKEQTTYPVFYYVDPSEVRSQTGKVAQGFAKHNNNKNFGKWKEAMRKAANLSGWNLMTTSNRR